MKLIKPLSVNGRDGSNDPNCTIEEMLALVEADENIMSGSKAAFFNLDCYLSIVFGIADNRPLYYLACQKCKKKVTEELA